MYVGTEDVGAEDDEGVRVEDVVDDDVVVGLIGVV